MVKQTAVGPVLNRLDDPVDSLADRVVAEVRAAMRAGRLVPGQLYSAYQLSDLLGVSRSPVREALIKLAAAGVVRLERNRGFRLVVPDAHDIAEIFELRLFLEVPAVRTVAKSRTEAVLADLVAELESMRAADNEPQFMAHDRTFHDVLMKAGGNARLAATVAGLRDVTMTLGASTVDRSRSLAQIAAEHDPVLKAIAARDPDAAEAAMAGHLAHTGQLLIKQSLRDNPVPDAEKIWRRFIWAV
jgi:DNA-binding GntR family transcriptional regulator